MAFWNGGITDNRLTVTLDREVMSILLIYLEYGMGKLKSSDPEIGEIMRRGDLTDGGIGHDVGGLL